jgi:hypothetical protein
MFLDNMENNFAMFKATEYASALGYLQGCINGMILYDDVSPEHFKHMYQSIVKTHEMVNNKISEYDMDRYKKRASEIGVTI